MSGVDIMAWSTLVMGIFVLTICKDQFARGRVHINGVEEFWGLAKVRLTTFKDILKKTFHLHVKEWEWRFNKGHLNSF